MPPALLHQAGAPVEAPKTERRQPMPTIRDQLATATALGNASIPACLVANAPAGAVPDRDGLLHLDLELQGGRVAALALGGTIVGAVDLGRRMVVPCFVDMHTHLDKGHIWPRTPNPDGSFDSALATVRADRERLWTAEDVEARFAFGLACAYAHGTRAVRTHLDSVPPQAEISFPVFAKLRDAWRGRIELQAVSLAMLEHYRGAEGRDLADIAAAHGGVLGVVPLMQDGLDADLDGFFGLAIERGLAIDCHIDETLDPGADTLRHLAEAALRNGYRGSIVAGHCCSLSTKPADEVDATLDRVAEAGIAIVSLPMCNMYLQDRQPGRTPRYRGVTLLHELKARGIQVAVASDNCRDPFYAYGDHDMHEVFKETVRIAHLDKPIGDWPRAATTTPSVIMDLDEPALIAAGASADLVIFEGRSWSEVLSRPESRRIVLRGGRPLDAEPPPYAELDRLYAPRS